MGAAKPSENGQKTRVSVATRPAIPRGFGDSNDAPKEENLRILGSFREEPRCPAKKMWDMSRSGRGDIRDIAGPAIRQPPAKGMIGRFIAAMKGGY